jgi:hypothetical protein
VTLFSRDIWLIVNSPSSSSIRPFACPVDALAVALTKWFDGDHALIVIPFFDAGAFRAGLIRFPLRNANQIKRGGMKNAT